MENNSTKILHALYGVADPEQIAKQLIVELRKHDANLDELVSKYLPALWLADTPSSIPVRYSIFRSTINSSNAKKKHAMLEKLYINPELTQYFKNIKDDKAVHNKEHKTEFDLTKFFETIENLSQKIKEIDLRKIHEIYFDGSSQNTNRTKERETAYLCAAYLGMVTGRRFTEIIKTMDIDRKGRNVMFSGILKKRSDEEETLENCVLLDEFETVKKALKILRTNFDTNDYTKAIVSKKFGLVYRNYLQKEILQDNRYGYHDLRKMYAQAAWEKYGKKTDIDQKTYIGQVLGHTKKVDATDHYMVLKTKENKGEKK